jgi:nucleoside-diphosphate-sugar epimerase
MKAVLITGADGYLGSRIAKTYALGMQRPVIAWLRAGSEAEFSRKRAALIRGFGADVPSIRCCYGDLRRADPFEGVSKNEVGAIIHAAAVTRFNVERELAREVNIEGTIKLLDFATRCPALESFGLLSTVYASGLQAGNVEEAPLDERREFANHYEWSKWQCESLLIDRYAHLPWRLFRVATVVADDERGSVAKHNAVHNTLKLLYYSLISLMPGRPGSPLYFVTAEFVTQSILELMRHPRDHAIYHIAHARKESLLLDEIIDVAWQAFLEFPDFARRRILKPVYTDLRSFDLLADGVTGFGGQVLSQALASMTPFARQLYVEKSVRNDNLVSACTRYRAPDPRRLVRNICAHLVHSKWQEATV